MHSDGFTIDKNKFLLIINVKHTVPGKEYKIWLKTASGFLFKFWIVFLLQNRIYLDLLYEL